MSELQAAVPRPESDRVPRHVAIIMDGNHRWAKARGLPGAIGHRAGSRNVRPIAEACADHGVEYLTLFALSTENLERPKREVDLLLDLMRRFLEDNVDELAERGVRLRIIGDRSRFSAELQMLMNRAEQMTRNNSKLHLTIAGVLKTNFPLLLIFVTFNLKLNVYAITPTRSSIKTWAKRIGGDF